MALSRKQTVWTVRFLALFCLVIPMLCIVYASYNAFHSFRVLRLYTSEPSLRSTSSHQGSHKDQEKILLVSALFPLAKSKHSPEDYASWLSRFLGSVKTDIYFFTTPEIEPMVTRLRGDLPIIINTTYSSPYEIPPLKGLQRQYELMHETDREKSYHAPDLYAVWNGKAFYLDEGLRNSQKKYEYAFWTDAGAFRNDHAYEYWPNYQRVEELWDEGSKMSGLQKHELFFIPTFWAPGSDRRDWKEDMGPVDIDFSEGSFFGGQPDAIHWWRNTFYAYHNYYLSRSIFVGKDQTLFNAILFLYSHRFITVWLEDPQAPARKGVPEGAGNHGGGGRLGSCGSEWYYYEFFLTDALTREKMRAIWATWEGGDQDEATHGIWHDFFKGRKTCRLTRLLWMRGLMERQFGKYWTPPEATVINYPSPKPWRAS
ncbi:hypothetical protein VKT23_015085 [Stygiomarasmius scandens]|uniref:Uncharacterized protein n=1 Tax=Marasmiellus scandens TaxID=2682957 RepID=A0ABR1J338_9AGAR